MITTNIKTLFGAKLVPYGSSINSYSNQIHIHGPADTGIMLNRSCRLDHGIYVFEVSCGSILKLLLRHQSGKEIQKKFTRTCTVIIPHKGEYQIIFLKTRRDIVDVASITIDGTGVHRSETCYQDDMDDLSMLLMSADTDADNSRTSSSIIPRHSVTVSDFDIGEMLKELKGLKN